MQAVTGTWMKSLPAAKAIAKENDMPLLVVSCASTCTHCKAAEKAVWSQPAWQAFAKAKGMPRYLASASPAAAFAVRNALHKAYNVPYWPTAFLFRIKPGADVTTAGLGKADVELVARFVYRAGKTINGIKVVPGVDDFTEIVESFMGW